MVARLSALRASRTLPPGFFIFKDFRKFAGSNSDEVDFLNWPNTSGRTGPGVDSASNRNEYEEGKNVPVLNHAMKTYGVEDV
jgi:hypothetical protein